MCACEGWISAGFTREINSGKLSIVGLRVGSKSFQPESTFWFLAHWGRWVLHPRDLPTNGIQMWCDMCNFSKRGHNMPQRSRLAMSRNCCKGMCPDQHVQCSLPRSLRPNKNRSICELRGWASKTSDTKPGKHGMIISVQRLVEEMPQYISIRVCTVSKSWSAACSMLFKSKTASWDKREIPNRMPWTIKLKHDSSL